MFQLETELIIMTSAQRTIGNQPAIAMKDIMAADIPYALKAFFRADVESMLSEELQQYHKNSRFNFESPEIQSLQHQISSALILHFSFERTEFLNRLNDTVHLMMNYLVRPQWTLTNVLFEKEETISSSALALLLRHFGSYEYLKDIIIRYTQDKNVQMFSRADFSSFLRRVDGEYIRRKTGDELARILSPLYEFLDYPNNSGTKTLPVKALIKYFEDKGLTSVIQRLEGELAQNNNEYLQRELGTLLEDVRRTSGAFEAERITQPSPAENIPVSILQENAELPATEKKETPVPTKYTARVTSAIVSKQQPASQSYNRSFSIDDNDRKRFIKKIFYQDETAFNDTLTAMDSLPSWKEASKYLDEIYIQNNIDPYCDEAEEFLEILREGFYRVS